MRGWAALPTANDSRRLGAVRRGGLSRSQAAAGSVPDSNELRLANRYWISNEVPEPLPEVQGGPDGGDASGLLQFESSAEVTVDQIREVLGVECATPEIRP
jgi:hypothetical protein